MMRQLFRAYAQRLMIVAGFVACCALPGAALHAQAIEELNDAARMFSQKAVDEARTKLAEASKRSQVPTAIETIKSLGGRTIQEVSLQNAMKSGRQGIYILLADEDRKIEVRVSRRFKGLIDPAAEREIRDAFINGLRAGDSDEGLRRGIDAIAKVLHAVKAPARPEASDELSAAPREASGSGGSRNGKDLVVRNQVRLTLSGARAIIEAAEARATAMGLKVNVAVVDDGGHLINFARMDGARPASVYTSLTKANTAATLRQETGPLPKGTTAPDPLLNIGLQNAAAASGGKITTLHGGVPVIVDTQVIGGVGVGGGTGEQDATIARAGVEAFLKLLATEHAPAKVEKPSEK
jgi:glc operon protein GlcG